MVGVDAVGDDMYVQGRGEYASCGKERLLSVRDEALRVHSENVGKTELISKVSAICAMTCRQILPLRQSCASRSRGS